MTHSDAQEDMLMQQSKSGTIRRTMRIFPLSPEAVRRLRQRTEADVVSDLPSDEENVTTTHADDLRQQLLQC
ncbi:MAG: hypothetical protein AAFQ09_11095 [Pseudomonadota bacterium]